MNIPKPIKVKAMCLIKRQDGAILASLGYDRVKDEHFVRLLGGHVEFSEKAEAALCREFHEELGCSLKDLSLIKVLENIFTYNGEPGHEIIFLYSGNLENESIYTKEKMCVLDRPETEVRWICQEDVRTGNIRLYPKFEWY